jgi:hypothetical protein
MTMCVTESVLAAVILSAWFTLIIYLTPTALRSDTSLSKPPVPPRKNEGRCRLLTAAQSVGVSIMSVVDEALARLTAFVKNALDQLKAARGTNDSQTVKLAELQGALDVALSDDAADKAAITALQVEIATLQDAVAAQINAAVDSLENAPVEVEAPVEVVEEAPVVEVEAPVEVVEEAPVVEVEAPVEVDTPVDTPVEVPVDVVVDAPVVDSTTTDPVA